MQINALKRHSNDSYLGADKVCGVIFEYSLMLFVTINLLYISSYTEKEFTTESTVCFSLCVSTYRFLLCRPYQEEQH